MTFPSHLVFVADAATEGKNDAQEKLRIGQQSRGGSVSLPKSAAGKQNRRGLLPSGDEDTV